MKDAKNIAQDLGIELVGAGIVALIVWLATITSGTVGIPTAAIILIAALAAIAVASLVSFLVRGRQVARIQSEVQRIQQTHLKERERVRTLRDEVRTIGEQLVTGDRHTILKSTTTYTIDPAGQDRIESEWVIAYSEDHQGRAFTTDDWSSEPPIGDVTCNSQTDDGTSVAEVLVVDEPTNKQYVLFLHPPVGKAQRTLQVRQTWPGLWNDLRKNGRDYVELSARTGLQHGVIRIHIPASVGRYKWNTGSNPAIRLSNELVGTQQTLTLTVDAPQGGTKYRADLVRE